MLGEKEGKKVVGSTDGMVEGAEVSPSLVVLTEGDAVGLLEGTALVGPLVVGPEEGIDVLGEREGFVVGSRVGTAVEGSRVEDLVEGAEEVGRIVLG